MWNKLTHSYLINHIQTIGNHSYRLFFYVYEMKEIIVN